MMQIEGFELELDRLINEAYKSGINYWQILKVFLSICQRLQMQADIEYHVKLQG